MSALCFMADLVGSVADPDAEMEEAIDLREDRGKASDDPLVADGQGNEQVGFAVSLMARWSLREPGRSLSSARRSLP